MAIPFLDLADACWRDARPAEPVGLLCTRYAVAGGIFQAAASRAGATLILPAPETAERVDRVIFDELIRGDVSEACVRTLRTTIAELVERGAASIILGNTDMTLAAERLREAAPVPLIDAARAHARVAARGPRWAPVASAGPARPLELLGHEAAWHQGRDSG